MDDFYLTTGLRSHPKSLLNRIITRRLASRYNAERRVASPQFYGSREESYAVCNKVLTLLKSTHVEQRRSFLYEDAGALLVGQRVLLNLANHVVNFSDFVPVSLDDWMLVCGCVSIVAIDV